jgi:hypothetical protein
LSGPRAGWRPLCGWLGRGRDRHGRCLGYSTVGLQYNGRPGAQPVKEMAER